METELILQKGRPADWEDRKETERAVYDLLDSLQIGYRGSGLCSKPLPTEPFHKPVACILLSFFPF